MKNRIVTFILILQTFLGAQQIYTNKDSLYYIPSVDSYGNSDTLWMYNLGTEVLIIDSAYSKFGYHLESIYADSISEFDYIYNDTINLHIPAQDSLMLIIENPDRCPVCKMLPNSDIYQDTIIFTNNSYNDPRYEIFTFISEYVGIENVDNIPIVPQLFRNYPNPFNPTTTMEFYVPKSEYVILEIFDSLGKNAKTIINGRVSPGRHKLIFNAKGFSSGIYFYKMSTPTYSKTLRMLILK